MSHNKIPVTTELKSTYSLFARETGSNLLTEDVWTIIKYPTIVSEVNGTNYNPSTGEFTAVRDAIISIKAHWQISGTASAAHTMGIRINKNGSTVSGAAMSQVEALYAGAAAYTRMMVKDIPVVAGDVITIEGFTNDANIGNATLSTNSGLSITEMVLL